MAKWEEMKVYIQIFLALSVFFSGTSGASADIGENCTVDITSSFTGRDWRSASVLRGDDGYLWRRANILSRDVLYLEEDKTIDIQGVSNPNTMVQVLFFSPEKGESGEIKKPGLGSCFSAEFSDESGLFHFPIHSRLIWEAINEEILFDAYYRTPILWKSLDEQKKIRTNQTFYVGTFLAPKYVRIVGKNGDSNGRCSFLCESMGMIRALTLNSFDISSDLLGNNLDAIGGEKVIVGRTPGPHTFYVSLNEETPEEFLWNILQRITHKILGMEVLKRTLLSNQNTNGIPPGLSEISVSVLQEAESDGGEYSGIARDLVKNVKLILVSRDFAERDSAAEKISQLIGSQNDERLFRASLIREVFIPDVSTEETWAEDFVNILSFWTGTLGENKCLIEDDAELWKNFIETNIHMTGNMCAEMR
jgi:hypothetical protein